MNIGKIVLGIILLCLIPTHWFLGGIVLSSLIGFPGIVVIAVWLMLFLGGLSLIFAGLNEAETITYTIDKPHKKESKHIDIDVKK